ncbi:MAG: hypothetical protein K1X83_09570 [Oligoflexia bacterium]|nr:hypothetical protein [Oligoflexia bacterium]
MAQRVDDHRLSTRQAAAEGPESILGATQPEVIPTGLEHESFTLSDSQGLLHRSISIPDLQVLGAIDAACSSALFRFVAGLRDTKVIDQLREYHAASTKELGPMAGALSGASDLPLQLSKEERAAWSKALTDALSQEVAMVPPEDLRCDSGDFAATGAVMGQIVEGEERGGLSRTRTIQISDAVFASLDFDVARRKIAGIVAEERAVDWLARHENSREVLLLRAAGAVFGRGLSSVGKEHFVVSFLASSRFYPGALQQLAQLPKIPEIPEEVLAVKRPFELEELALKEAFVAAKNWYTGRPDHRPGVSQFAVATRFASTVRDLGLRRSVQIAALFYAIPPKEILAMPGGTALKAHQREVASLVRGLTKLNTIPFNLPLPKDTTLPDYSVQYSWNRCTQSIGSIARSETVKREELLQLWGAFKLEEIRSITDKHDSKKLQRLFDDIRFFVAPQLQRPGERELSRRLLDTWEIAYPTENLQVEMQKDGIFGMSRAERRVFVESRAEQISISLGRDFGLVPEAEFRSFTAARRSLLLNSFENAALDRTILGAYLDDGAERLTAALVDKFSVARGGHFVRYIEESTEKLGQELLQKFGIALAPETRELLSAHCAEFAGELGARYGLVEGRDFTVKSRENLGAKASLEKPNFSAWEKSIDDLEQIGKEVQARFPGDIANQNDLLSLQIEIADTVRHDLFERIKEQLHEDAGLGELSGLPADYGSWMRERVQNQLPAPFVYELQIGRAERFRLNNSSGGAPRKSEERHLNMKVKRAWDNSVRRRLQPSSEALRDWVGAAFHHSDPPVGESLARNYARLHRAISERYLHVALMGDLDSVHDVTDPIFYEHRFPRGSSAADLVIRKYRKAYTDYVLQRREAHPDGSYWWQDCDLTTPLQPGAIYRTRKKSARELLANNGHPSLQTDQVASVCARMFLASQDEPIHARYSLLGAQALESKFGPTNEWLLQRLYRPLCARYHLDSLGELYNAVGSGLIAMDEVVKYHEDRFATVTIDCSLPSDVGETDPWTEEVLTVEIDSNAGNQFPKLVKAISNRGLSISDAIVVDLEQPGAKQFLVAVRDVPSANGAQNGSPPSSFKTRVNEVIAEVRDQIRPEREEKPRVSDRHERTIVCYILDAPGALNDLLDDLGQFGIEVAALRLSPDEIDLPYGDGLNLPYRALTLKALGPGSYRSIVDELRRSEVTEKLIALLGKAEVRGLLNFVEVEELVNNTSDGLGQPIRVKNAEASLPISGGPEMSAIQARPSHPDREAVET